MTISKIQDYPMPMTPSYFVNKVDWQPDPKRAVLFIHDMQHYFINFYEAHASLVERLIQNLVRLREWAYENHIPVVYTVQLNKHSDQALLNAIWGPDLPVLSPDLQAIIDPLKPSEKDIVLNKWRYSTFARSYLRERMHCWGRDQLIVGGVYAQIGCMITSVDAFMNDMQTFLVGDAVADFSAEEHLMALKFVSSRCGKVIATDSLLDTGMRLITQK